MRMQTSIRVEKEFYEEAKEVFKKFGLSFGDAVNMFLAKVAMEKGIPFELKVPSEELEKRMENIENNKNVQTYNNSEEFFEDVGL
jgi:DNA-damage-inducible protein J